MQQFSLCFGKVKKDCLKFIKSQETKADKFKNKEKMIKFFLIVVTIVPFLLHIEQLHLINSSIFFFKLT